MTLTIRQNDTLENSWEVEIRCRFFGGTTFYSSDTFDPVIIMTSLFFKRKFESYTETDLFCFSALFLAFENRLMRLTKHSIGHSHLRFNLNSCAMKSIVVMGFTEREADQFPPTCENVLEFSTHDRQDGLIFNLAHDFQLLIRKTRQPSLLIISNNSPRDNIFRFTKSEVQRTMSKLRGMMDASMFMFFDDPIPILESTRLDEDTNTTSYQSMESNIDRHSSGTEAREPSTTHTDNATRPLVDFGQLNPRFKAICWTIVKNVFMSVISCLIFIIVQTYYDKFANIPNDKPM
ncbi:MAG: hypothetical protein SaRV1_gp2 [Sanya rhabdovirus 1]|nr:MAG: hypothetical protein SaRV1_gp2 [Sanya rhabdovirus 1]